MEQLSTTLMRLTDIDPSTGLPRSYQALSATERRIAVYLRYAMKAVKMDQIEQTDGIYDYYTRFLSLFFPAGLYVLDGQRIWTPICSGRLEVSILAGVPKDNANPVYGLCHYKYSRVFYSTSYILVFAGCVKADNGVRFISSIRGFSVYGTPENTEHSVITRPGIHPKRELCYTFVGQDITNSSPARDARSDVPGESPPADSSDDDYAEYEEQADDWEDQ